MRAPCIKEQPLAGLTTFMSASCPELLRAWVKRRKRRSASMTSTSGRNRTTQRDGSMRLK